MLSIRISRTMLGANFAITTLIQIILLCASFIGFRPTEIVFIVVAILFLLDYGLLCERFVNHRSEVYKYFATTLVLLGATILINSQYKLLVVFFASVFAFLFSCILIKLIVKFLNHRFRFATADFDLLFDPANSIITTVIIGISGSISLVTATILLGQRVPS